MQDLKLDISIIDDPWWTMEVIWDLFNPIFLVKHKTLDVDPCLGGGLTSQLLSSFEYLRPLLACFEENGRENFGVQQWSFTSAFFKRFLNQTF